MLRNMKMSPLTLGVLVLVLGVQVLCSPEAQSATNHEGQNHEELSTNSDAAEEDLSNIRVMHKRAPSSYDFGLGKKRGYTYVSEYKRLPVYNFGLGKRSTVNDYDKYKHFLEGLEEDGDEEPAWNDEVDESSKEDDVEDDTYDVDPKRARPYSFGLGKRLSSDSSSDANKRMSEYAFGLGKKASYEFGLGKRSPYEFGLGKRSPYEFGLGRRSYEFGLGKRAAYEFGLGKRSPYEFGLGKRSPYEFGLGKRSPYEFGLGKRSPYEFGLGKRAAYEFGLGKKSGTPGKRLTGRYRQYDYALGRRQRDLNRFNFGLGKRSAPTDDLDLIFGEKDENADGDVSN